MSDVDLNTLDDTLEDLRSAIDAIELAPMDDIRAFRMQIEEARSLIACANDALKMLDCAEFVREYNAAMAGMA